MSEVHHIGFRGDPDYNIRQYEKHAKEYIAANPQGKRGGRTPDERASRLGNHLPLRGIVYEVGSAAGYDAWALHNLGFNVIPSDVTWAFISYLRESRGFRNVEHFDARKDHLPKGINGVMAHIVFHHLSPKQQGRFLSEIRGSLNEEKGYAYISTVEGWGHEESSRTGGFKRRWHYSTEQRLRQLFTQEGFVIIELAHITAENNTPTIHIVAALNRDYKGGSYGERELHPYGDTYYDINLLFKRDIFSDLAETGLLDHHSLEFIRAAETTYEKGIIDFETMVREINREWIGKRTGKRVRDAVNHFTHLLNGAVFREFVEPAFAVCNNNGFSNNIIGYLPSWLIACVAEKLGADGHLSVADWVVDDQGCFTGEVKYYKNESNQLPGLKEPIRTQQRELEKYLGTRYRRITVDLGSSLGERGILEIMDYPMLVFANKDTLEAATRKGYFNWFNDEYGGHIHAGSHPWSRWGVLDNDTDTIKYLNMVTSDRYPVLHNRHHPSHLPLWSSTNNQLNEAFYRDNPLEVDIL